MSAPPVRFALPGVIASPKHRFLTFARKRLWLIALAIGVSLFAVYVWPTAYRYDHVQLGQYQLVVRTNRLTGQVQQLTRNGWVAGAYYRPF